MRVLGTLALTIALALAVGASAQDCDWAAVGGDAEEVGGDIDQALVDSATIYEIAEGESVNILLDGFWDMVHAVDGYDSECRATGDADDGFWIAWDHDEGADWTYPDDVVDYSPDVGGGAGVGDLSIYGFFIVFHVDDSVSAFIVIPSSGGPNLTLGVEGNTFDEEGGDITLTANEDMIEGGSLQWQKNGVNIGGQTGATFGLVGAMISDSGNYSLNFEDGEGKAIISSNVVSISIFATDSLPVSGLIGLGLLAAVSALGGVVALRKKK